MVELSQVCKPEAGSGVLEQQHLFSVHIHTPPSHPGYRQDSTFHGREIAARTETGWGKFGLTQALINLLAAGLQDPLNQQLLMLSEACVPLYPPAVVYNQIMHEEKSRINACANEGWVSPLPQPAFKASPVHTPPPLLLSLSLHQITKDA